MKSSSNLERFTNPITHDSAITIRDHFIIKVKSRWFCVGTSNPVWTGHNPMLFSSWTRGYEVGLLKSRNPLGPWEFASREPIFGTRKKGYRPELAASGSYAHLQFDDTEDPYCETGP
ncbi:MAG TPA: hypothetical protein VIN08_18440 [Ohtaekwangia sp.]|uniref:hypothetical protein n=1 Tax=Ohtaekwangia sp. TaxID=2066019 RepID=UPI002F94A2B5